MNAAHSPFERTVVTAATFTRQFGLLRHSATTAPVFVSHHGRETHFLLSIDAYRALAAKHPTDQPEEIGALPTAAECISWMYQGCIILDNAGQIVTANQIVHAMTGRKEGELVGQSIYQALPEIEGSLVQSYINRAMMTREPCVIDLPSVFRPSSWIRLEAFPSVGFTTLIVHDITFDVKANRLADPKSAVMAALNAHGAVGTLTAQCARSNRPCR